MYTDSTYYTYNTVLVTVMGAIKDGHHDAAALGTLNMIKKLETQI